MHARALRFVGLALAVACLTTPALARPVVSNGQGRTPYLERDGAPADPLRTPLVATDADVDIAGDVARVTLTQVYRNLDPDPIEVVYVFPGSTRAAVTGLVMTVGDRVIVARIHERQEARQVYEEAKDAGKTATLLEMNRPNELRMSVANIQPGEAIQVEVEYVERLRSDDGEYELVLPGPVAPRFDGEATPVSAAAHADVPYLPPTLRGGMPWGPTRGISVELQAPVPLDGVYSPSHRVPELRDPGFYHYAHTELGGAPRDFVLRYRLGGELVSTGVLRYDGEDGQRYFMATIQPPLRVPPATVAPREYVFVLDTSGSMNGWPLETAKSLMTELLGGLRPSDTFNIIAFAGGAALLSERSLPATPANVRRMTVRADQMKAGGGTQLLDALGTAFGLPATPGVARTFVIVSDGFVSVAPQAYRMIRERAGDANVFAFGIGARPNRDLIERVAAAGRGEPMFVSEEGEAYDVAQRFRRYIEAPVLTDVQVTFHGLRGVDVTPAAQPDLFAQRPLVVTGKLEGEGGGDLIVTGRAAFGAYSAVIDLGAARPDPANAAIATFWARDRVADLGDREAMGEDVKAEIVKLGLAHHLLTRYTSFVAVDEVVRGQGDPKTVVQPLPGPAEPERDMYGQMALAGKGKRAKAMAQVLNAEPLEANRLASAMGGAQGFGAFGVSGSGDGGGGVGRIHGLGDIDTRGSLAEAASKRIRATLKLLVTKVAGALEKSHVNAVVRRRASAFRYCYERELVKDPTLKGTLELKIAIGGDGRVSTVSVGDGLNATVRNCVASKVKRLRFMEPGDGGVTTVELRLLFAPSS